MNVVRASSGHQANISSSSSPILSSSPSVHPRKHQQPPQTSTSSSQLATSSSRAKRQIACPLPLKVPFCASTTATSKSQQQPAKQDGVSDFSDATRGDEWEERNVLFDDNFGYSGCHHTSPSANDDGESLINLIEAEWELEQIFRTAPVAANPHQRLARWVLNDEDHPLDLEEDGSPSWMLAEDHLPRLGFSPQEMLQEEEELVATPPPQLFVIPPSRARNPVPLNTPFQASSRVQHYANSSPFYVEQLKQQQQQPLADYDYRGLYAVEQRMEECSLLSPSSSSPSLAASLSPSSSTLGGHMRKRNRSYSDSMLKRDSLGDMTNSLVLVS